MKYEFGDKTFLLLVLFCFIWQNTKGPDNKGLCTYDRNIQALRIFSSSTIGICVVAIIALYKENNIYSLQTNALVAIALIVALVVYMYLMCVGYLTILNEDETGKEAHNHG